ncbi:MAG: hypothetical protein WA861_02430, partial [Candidatus Binatus sp.]
RHVFRKGQEFFRFRDCVEVATAALNQGNIKLPLPISALTYSKAVQFTSDHVTQADLGQSGCAYGRGSNGSGFAAVVHCFGGAQYGRSVI